MKYLRERDERSKEEFPRFIEELRTGKWGPTSAILFGSRARGEASFMSDFDVLLITPSDIDAKALRMWAREFRVDLFVVPENLATELISGLHTVLLDALTQGRVLYDDREIIPLLRETCQSVIEARNLQRTLQGWVLRSAFL
ncbi:MAG: nucleotidyltransferase domain-containing protein [Candidatus Thorarchaeota archaeon]|nr:nucleotidyltransferase domain-containing protein [Candidatus Thorarchaeota archaeon]